MAYTFFLEHSELLLSLWVGCSNNTSHMLEFHLYILVYCGRYSLSRSFHFLFAHNIEEFLGRKNSLLFLAFYQYFDTFSLHFWCIMGAIFVFFFYFARGFASVLLNDYVNIIVPSQIRATVLSIQTLMFRFVFVIIGPLVGWISDTYSLQVGLFFAGCIFSLFL